ncbi:MAG: hypothetical protein ACJ8AW_49055 [Rhodopila sp.]
MATLKQSLGHTAEKTLRPVQPQKPAKAARKKADPDVRQQPGLKLPIKGGKPKVEAKVEAPLKLARKRA